MIETTPLRKKLLDLAISGKLVPKTGAWKTVKLGDIGQVRMCKRILKGQTLSQGDIPFFKIGTFGKAPTSYIARSIFEEYVNKYPYPSKGDILISAAGTIGRVVVFDGQPAYFQDSNIVWLEHDCSEVYNQYLYWYYQTSPWRVTRGTTIPRLYNENILNAEIPLPPLAEQKAIVKRLEELLALEREIAADAAALNDLITAAKRKILDLAISGKLVPKMGEWKTVKLGEVCFILDSLRKPITKKNRKPGTVPYYGATCIQDYVEGYIFDEPLVLLGEDGAKWGPGDISAFCIEGKSWVNNHAHVLRPNRSVNHDWLVCYLEQADLREYITGTTVPKLNQEKMRSIPIPLPPLAEQKAIVKRVEELFAVLDAMKEV